MAKVKAIPEGIHSITPALILDGCADAITFFKRAFGAEELTRAPDPSGKKIWHAALRIGDSVIFLNDTFPDMAPKPVTARLWLYAENVDGAYKRAMDAGAQSKMAPADMFWGDRIAEVHDRWGNAWVLAQHIRDMTPEEMKKAQDAFVASMKK